MDNPLKHFADLRDPRVKRTREHLLEQFLLMDIAAILSGANWWNKIEVPVIWTRVEQSAWLRACRSILHFNGNDLVSGRSR